MDRSGFTMVELLVVLMIILVMAVVAIASLSGAGTAKQQLRREARDVISLFKEARQTAMERKVKVDIYVDPTARAVCAVESGYGRKQMTDGVRFSDLEPESNRFFRVIVFPEEIEIEAFMLSDIETDTTGEEPLFEPVPEKESAPEFSGPVRPVFSFTHLGGASGGGISVIRDGLRIDIACDLLTGMPEIVRRRSVR